MGLAASQARLLMLVARKSDIEFQIQLINQRRTALAYQSSALAQRYANAMYQSADPTVLTETVEGDSSTKQNVGALPGLFFNTDASGAAIPVSPIPLGYYEAQMSQVQSIDKALELRETDLNTQHNEVQTEYDAVKKVIEKNIEMSFKTLG